MEKENLDDLMRQKFDTDDPGARFEFREEYWEQAQALIEADERRRKRRFLWWWFFAGLLVAGGSGLFWYGSNQIGHSTEAVQVTAPSHKNKEANDRDNKDANASFSELNTGEKEQEPRNTQADGRKNDRPTPSESEALSGGISSNSNSPANEMPAGRRTINAKTNPLQSPRVSGASAGRLRNASKTTGKQSLHMSDEASENAAVPSKANRGSAADSKSERAENMTGTAANTSSEKEAHPTTASTDVARKDGMAPNPSMDSLKTSAAIAPVNHHLDPLPPIEYQTYAFLPRILFFPRAATPERAIKPAKTSRFKVDLNTAATYYNTEKGTPWLGGTAGVSAEYRFYQQFRVFAGAAWRYIPIEKPKGIDTASNFTSSQLRYGFGYEQDYQTIRPVAFHALEFPIGLRWRWNAFAVEAGIAPSRLMAVRAHLLSARESSFEPPDFLNPNIEEKKIWIDARTERYRQAWVSAFAGVEWGTGRLKLSVRGFRMPGNVLPEQQILTPPRNKYLFGAEAGLRWRFSD